MQNVNNVGSGKIKQSEHIFALKIKTESNGLGVLKTFVVLFLILLQFLVLALSYLYMMSVFQWYLIVSLVCTFTACIHVLSSDFHGQAKATWILFMLVCYSFGWIIYLMSERHVLFAKERKQINKIIKSTYNLQTQIDLSKVKSKEVITNCNYLYNNGKFVAHSNCKVNYYPSGAKLFDAVLEDLKNAKEFIFIEFYIIAEGVLLNRFLDILTEKVQQGVDVRIIYDDMGSHGTLKRRTKKMIKQTGIKLQSFNRMVPVFNIALNLRDHRKIVVIDGKVGYTGGTNLADEYINEKRSHGYWKDGGIRVEGSAVDNLTIAYLSQWQFLTNSNISCERFIGKAGNFDSKSIVVPYVSGPNYEKSIAQNMYANEISNAKEKLYIMTPYFIPDETITNLLINKALSGVDVRIILPHIADKNFVYIVSRNNAEKLLKHGVKIYTMTNSFVHSKIMLTENSAIVGSINMDLRSFNQQFESAVFTDDNQVLQDVLFDFVGTLKCCHEITVHNMKRKKFGYRALAGLFNLVSPFM